MPMPARLQAAGGGMPQCKDMPRVGGARKKAEGTQGGGDPAGNEKPDALGGKERGGEEISEVLHGSELNEGRV